MPDTALIISATVPDPPDTGKRVVLRGLIRHLAERLGADNVHFALVGANAAPPIPLPMVVHHLDRPSTVDQLAGVARCLTRPSYTLQEAMLGSAQLQRQVHEIVDRLRPSIEIYDTLRMGQHAPAERSSARRILYVDDLFSVRYARMLEMAEREQIEMDPLGNFAHNIPAGMRSITRRPGVYMPLLRFERKRLERREAEIVRDFDLNLLVNADEVALLGARAGVSTVRALTPLLPPVPVPSRAPAYPPELVFLGNLNLPHNEDAVSTFMRRVLPEMERRGRRIRLRIIGRNAGPALLALAASHPETVVMEGFVEDLDAAFSRATAVIGPLRFGSGIKIKMLESFARSVPLLATSTAAEGIPIGPDGVDGAVVEDDFGRWAELITELGDPGRNARLSAAALDFFARTYSPAVVAAQYDQIFELGPAETS